MKRLIALATISAGLLTSQAAPHYHGGFRGGHYGGYHHGGGASLGIGLGVGLLAGGLIYHDWVHRRYYSDYPVYGYPAYQPVYQYQATYSAPIQNQNQTAIQTTAPQPQPTYAPVANSGNSMASANSLFGR